MQHVETVILGGGLAGLATALHLPSDWLLVEKEARLGGLCRTKKKDGFRFDYTGHWMHLRHDHTRDLVESLLGDDIARVERRSRIYSNGGFTLYPFQANLHGLPHDVAKACLLGVIEAKRRAAVAEARGETLTAANFLEYVNQHFGEGIAEHFMVPYNTKLWGVEPTEITADWCSRFVPKPSLDQVVDGALSARNEALGYNASFVYPAAGGIETLVIRMAERLAGGDILTETVPTRIDWRARRMELSDGREVSYDHLVSSIPLPELLKVLVDPPAAVTEAASKLRCTTLRFVDLGLRVDRPFDGVHWVYLPEHRFPFYRIGCASNAVASLAPEGCASCYVEVSNAHRASDDEVKSSLKEFLREIGTIRAGSDGDEQVAVTDMRTIDYGYVIFDENYFPARETIYPFLEEAGVQSVGRYGRWVYSSMEDALDEGITAARSIRKAD